MWDEALQNAYKLLEGENKHQRDFWKIAFEIKKEFGSKGLRDFSEDLKENFGITKSYHTLRQYAYVHWLTVKYKLPEDLTYVCIRQIPLFKNPEAIIERIKKEGLSSAEVVRLAYQEKPKKKKVVVCPNCKKEISLD